MRLIALRVLATVLAVAGGVMQAADVAFPLPLLAILVAVVLYSTAYARSKTKQPRSKRPRPSR